MLECAPLTIVAEATGVVAQLSSNLGGVIVFSRISGTNLAVAADGAVSLSVGLAAGATVTLVARAQNSDGEAVEDRFLLTAGIPDVGELSLGTVTFNSAMVPGEVVADIIGLAPGGSVAMTGEAIASGKLAVGASDDEIVVGANGPGSVGTSTGEFTLIHIRAAAPNSPRPCGPFGPFEVANAGGTIATVPQEGITKGLGTLGFGTLLPTGTYADGSTFSITTTDVALTDSPPAVIYDQPSTTTSKGTFDLVPAWVHGMELNPGIDGSQEDGKANLGGDSSQLFALDERTGFAGQGVSIASRLSSDRQTADGYWLNRSIGYTGVPLAIAAGDEGSVGKAVSKIAPVGGVDAPDATDRLDGYYVHHFVSEAPAIGAFAPAPCAPDKTPVIFESDIDLSGLPNFSPPSSAPSAVTGPAPDMHHGSIATENWRYNCDKDSTESYGASIARPVGDQILLLLTNIPEADKHAIAKRVIKRAIGITGRIRQGGRLGGTSTSGYGGQVHQWPCIVAVAAWLTRNSTRGAYFRELLSGPLAGQFNAHFGAPRVVQDQDWVNPVAVWDREAPGGTTNPGYFSMQARPSTRGAVMSSPNITQPGDGGISNRIGQRDYQWLQYGTALGFALFLSLVPGGRELVPYPSYWRWMEMLADVSIWHRQYGSSASSGNYRFEGYVRGTYVSTFVEDCLLDPNLKWPFQPAAPALVAVEYAPNYELLREIADGSRVFATEHPITFRFDQTLSRNQAWLPVLAAFTLSDSSGALNIDTTGAAGGDPREIGAIQIRDGNLTVFATRAPTGTVIASYNPTAAGASAARTPAGQLAPAVVAATATLVSQPLAKPSPQDLMSYGGFPDGEAPAAADTPKFFWTAMGVNYPLQKYGLVTSTPIRGLLFGLHMKLAPGGLSRTANVCLIGESSITSGWRVFAHFNDLSVRLYGPSGSVGRVATFSNALSASDDNVLQKYWIHCTVTNGVSQAWLRIGDRLMGPVSFSGTWDDAQAMKVADIGRFGVAGYFDGSTNPVPLNPSRIAILETYIAIGTEERGLGTVDLSDNSHFGGSASSGPRGGGVLPDRPDYSGHDLNGIPEFLFSPTKAQLDAGMVPNLGAFSLYTGSTSDPEGTKSHLRLEQIGSVPDFVVSGDTVATGWGVPVFGTLTAENAPGAVFELIGETPVVILED